MYPTAGQTPTPALAAIQGGYIGGRVDYIAIWNASMFKPEEIQEAMTANAERNPVTLFHCR